MRTVDGRTTTWRFDRAAWDAQQRRPVDYYAESSGDKERMRLYPPTSTRRLRVEGAGEGTGTVAPLVPPTTPPLPDGESPRWDNVFSADHRPTYLQFIFCGLNIAKLNPADLQSPTGAVRDQVFLSPASASGYHMAATSRFLVPNGWRIGLDRTGSTSTRTVAANSEQEIQKTWSTNLGFSADADAMGAELAFSHNESAQHELNKSTSEATSSTLSDAVTCDHYVVIDLATVALHPGFKAAAIDTAAAPTPARIREFIYRYGAHFVHAITFGTRSYEHRYYKSASVSARRSDGHSHEDHAKVGFHTEVMGQKTGGSLSATQGGNEQLAKAFTEGADYTTEGVTTLGNEGNPVPVMFDLEPITTLLSPVFFTDPLVYRDLRPTVEQMIREHGSSILGAVAPSGS